MEILLLSRLILSQVLGFLPPIAIYGLLEVALVLVFLGLLIVPVDILWKELLWEAP